jgi:hypothetical protein
MESSGWGRVLSVLWAPGKTFTAIAARPTWVIALVVLALLGSLSVYFGFSKVEAADLARMLEEQGRELPPNAPSPEAMLKFSLWGAVVAAALGAPLFYVLTALLFWVTLRLLGSEMDFRRSLSVTLHGIMPLGVAALIGIPVALGRDTISMEELQSGQFLMSNLGFLASEETSKAVLALLTSVDVFSIWCIALLTIGYQIVARVSRGTALGTVLALWIVGVLIKVGMAAAFA